MTENKEEDEDIFLRDLIINSSCDMHEWGRLLNGDWIS